MDLRRFQKLPAWIPNEKSGGRMQQFMKRIEDNYKKKFADYFELHKWSVENISDFWAEMWDFTGIIYSKTYDQVIDLSVPMEDCPRWFEGAKLNYAENLLKFRDDRVAIISKGEDSETKQLTYRQLYEEVKVYAAAFRSIGVKKGDRVACYMSNRKEAVIAMIAVTSIGAIWTGALPLSGSQAYLNRVSQVTPTALITVDQFSHNKEIKNLLKNIKEIAEGMPSLKKVIIVPSKSESKNKDISAIPNSCFLDEFLQSGRNPDGSVPEIKFEPVSFSHPVFISYTSGTTGLPKTIVHGFGALLFDTKDFWLHWNSRREDVWLSMSPVGWVSWNIMNHALFLGETVAMFEGVPYFLSPTYLWDMIDELKLTKVFIPPSVIDELESRDYLPTPKHDLKSLEMILTSGSVVKPHNYNFALKKIKNDVMFSVGYACTEIMGFCMVSDHSLPVYRGEISAPSLGVAVECLDEEGNSVIGEMGEFVITKPIPSLPLGLWGDNAKREKLKKSYFSKFPGYFTIGDTIIINPVTNGIICCGRSDETLKPRGCRFGSSEIYNIVEHFSEIRDSICVAQFSKDMDERAVLFVKMQDGFFFNEELVQKLRLKITEELSSRHVPDVILETPEIPHNVNGKKMEIIVKKIINNMSYNAEMVSNPDCLKYYYNIPELQGF